MPRRRAADRLALRVGARIRELREEADLTLERLAQYAEVSKGHLSSIERGLVRPTISTLERLAGGLDAEILDLVTFPADGPRHAVVDRTRHLGTLGARRLLKDLDRH